MGLGVGAAALTWAALTPGAGRPAGSSRLYDAFLARLYGGQVPTVQPQALARELRQHPDSLVLLDTRTPAEYRVSHLRGAQLLNYATYREQQLAGMARHRPVVVYCSVGARSQNVGEYLRQLGFTDVRNLYGGLFEWVNEGHPVYNQAGPTDAVHPYNTLWGLALRRGR